MADNEKKVDLRDIEPLRPPPDDDATPAPHDEDADRISPPTAGPMSSPPPVGVGAHNRQPTTEDEELEHLRRG